MKIFNLPDLGEGLPDAEIREWHVKLGDEVKIDQPMVSMETAKAVVEVPAPRNGKISKLYGKPGDIIQTGQPLVEFTDGEEATLDKPKDSGTVAGSIEIGNTILDEPAMGITPKSASTGIKAIPAVRALAKRLNIDLSSITPSGANGQITAEDVERASANRKQNEGFEPLRGVRRAMAISMSQSHAEVVPITLVDDADVHAWPKDTDITLRVIRAIVAACQAEPALNAWYDTKTMSRRLFSSINLGLAMDSSEGLFVPVLRDIGNRTMSNLRAAINLYKEQIQSRSIPPEALREGTFMLSNFGTFAGRYANPIIVPPVVAILGTGKIRDEVIAHNGEVVIHRIMPLSLSVDHRAITGGEATRFLAAVIKDLELKE